MKKLLLISLFAAALSCSTSQKKDKGAETQIDSARITTITLKVEGMTCTGCEQTICKSVEQLAGVTVAKASYLDSTATITFDTGISSVYEISKQIGEAGYKVVPAVQNGI